jgi:hypothetical protein
MRDRPLSNRQKINELALAGYAGFCGGPAHATDYFDKLQVIDARTFAWCILIAEGFPEDSFEYETTWRHYFEQMFRDVFGDDAIELD